MERTHAVVMLVTWLLIVAACGSSADDSDPAALLADYEAARNSGDVDAVMALYADGSVVESHPLDSDESATGVVEIRRLEARIPRIQGSTGGIEYTEMVVSGNTATFKATFHNEDGDCFGTAGHEVTVESGRITRWVWGPTDPSLCG